MDSRSCWDADGEDAKVKMLYEFDCPECDANNPYPDGFGQGTEVRCFYCGSEYRVCLSEGGKWKFRMI